MRVRIPANNWRPRSYQLPLWKYLENGGKRAVCVWHRRAGKDENCLHWACIAGHQRKGTYWHMLPEASQARKAIWEAINPHTGKRRIDEAFPYELRETTRENEMMIKLKAGSTWQVVGSDNFNSLVGSPPIGVTFSEYSIANPSSWAYIRPILKENGGWAFFIYTPRGRNHGHALYQGAKSDPTWFSQILTADQTDVFSKEDLAQELKEYQREYGIEQGQAFFDQEYMCSFDSAVLGAIYASWIRSAEQQGRVSIVPYDPKFPVHTAWDLGYDDSTAIWWWQVNYGEVRVIDFYQNSQQGTDHYCEQLRGLKLKRRDNGEVVTDEKGRAEWTNEVIPLASHRQEYRYGRHWVPHDAANELMAAGGRSIVQQAWNMGIEMSVIPATSQQNGIDAARKTLPRCYFDEQRCGIGLNALRSYQFEWDTDLRTFKSKPRHDWSSHAADAFEIIGQVWQVPQSEKPKPKPRFLEDMTANEVFYPKAQNVYQRERI